MPLNVRADEYWSEHRVDAMGSGARIVLGDAPDGLADWAVAELERLEQCWSRFRPDSELRRLHTERGSWTPVSPALLLALTCAADLYRATSGCFDPTILDALEHAGYDRSFELIDRSSAAICRSGTASGPTVAPGFGRIDIDVDGSRVRVPRDVRIDLGGLGKGLAADLLARGLVDRGARTALVGLGGDLRARGEAPDGAWEIPVEHPLDDARLAFRYPLAEGALVTSTTRVRAWTRRGRRYHHLIDPATGDSARNGVAAVVAAATDAWWAEGIAKAVLIAGAQEGVELARRTHVRAWLFLDDGRMIDVRP